MNSYSLTTYNDSLPRLIIVGKTGSGKSSLLNWLCGVDKKFAVSNDLTSQTSECQIEVLKV